MDENGREARRLSADSMDRSEEKRLREALEARPEVVFAYLFGSAVEGPRHGRSDVDVAVYLDPQRHTEDGGAAAELRMLTVLRASLQDAVPQYEVDLIPLDRRIREGGFGRGAEHANG